MRRSEVSFLYKNGLNSEKIKESCREILNKFENLHLRYKEISLIIIVINEMKRAFLEMQR